MNKKHTYYVTYTAISNRGFVHGAKKVDTGSKIETWEDVMAIKNTIEEKFGFNNIIISNWKELK